MAAADQSADYQADENGIVWLDEEQGRAMFDMSSRRMTGLSGEDFLRRWDSGEFDDLERHDPDHFDRLDRLVALRDFAGL